MKICPKCEKKFPLTSFAWKNKATGKRQSQCDECRHEAQQKSYYKHHGTNLIRIKTRQDDLISWYRDIKNNLSCCVCSENEPACLDFHHLDSTGKDFNLAHSRGSHSKKRMMEELSKCACLCANCHRKYHAGKLNAPLVKLDITQLYES